MKLNQKGLDLIKSFEKCRLKAYPDPGTGGAPYTVGWGQTGPDITKDTVWTQEKADRRLGQHLATLVSDLENRVSGLNDNEFSALVSLVYNIGIGHFKYSTMLKLIKMKAPKSEIADEFLKWNTSGGRVLDGLTRRRAAERKLFLSLPSVE